MPVDMDIVWKKADVIFKTTNEGKGHWMEWEKSQDNRYRGAVRLEKRERR